MSGKFIKVYPDISRWPKEHSERVRDMYQQKLFKHVKGSPQVHDVIDDGNLLMLLTDRHGMSLYDHALSRGQSAGLGNTPKQVESNLATWFTQILRSMSRASDQGIYFERMRPDDTLFMNDKGQVTICDFTGCTYINNKSDTGFVRCKRDMVAPMLSPPEIERQASGDHCIEEDTLVTGEIWIAGAIIYHLLSRGSKYPSYEAMEDGRHRLVIPDSMCAPFSHEMKRFLRDVLEWEPEYRPRDYVDAVEHDWIVQHRREAMVPTMKSMRDDYNSWVAANRGGGGGGGGGVKKSVSHAEMSRAKKSFEARTRQNRLIMVQGERDLEEGCSQFVQSNNLQKEFISGYGWAPTKYEKKILEGTYDGLLPSNVLGRQPIEAQRKKRAFKRASNDFRSLTLYSDDYSQMPNHMESHMQEVLDDVTPPDYDASHSLKLKTEQEQRKSGGAGTAGGDKETHRTASSKTGTEASYIYNDFYGAPVDFVGTTESSELGYVGGDLYDLESQSQDQSRSKVSTISSQDSRSNVKDASAGENYEVLDYDSFRQEDPYNQESDSSWSGSEDPRRRQRKEHKHPPQRRNQ